MLVWMRHHQLAFQFLKDNLQNRNGRDVLETTIGLRQRPEQILSELMVGGTIGVCIRHQPNPNS